MEDFMDVRHLDKATIPYFNLELVDLHEMFMRSANNLEAAPHPILIAAMALASMPAANTLAI